MSLRFFSATLSLLLISGCTTPNPDYRPGSDGIPQLAPHLQGDSGASPPGDGVPPTPTEPEAGTNTPPTPPTPPPITPPPEGDGTLCESQGECPAGETCLFMEKDADKGICLRSCTKPDQPCELGDPNLVSGCSTYWSSDVGKIQVCAIFCQLNYKTHPCPNATDYKCKPYGPGMGACIPK